MSEKKERRWVKGDKRVFDIKNAEDIKFKPYDKADKIVSINLDMLGNEYKESPNPVLLIRAFLFSFRYKVYPPNWVLYGIMRSFKEYDDAKGILSFDEILGLKLGSGKTDPYKTVRLFDRDYSLSLDVFKVKYFYPKLNQKEAFVVAKELYLIDNKENEFSEDSMSYDSLEPFYTKAKKYFEEHNYETFLVLDKERIRFEKEIKKISKDILKEKLAGKYKYLPN